MERTKLKKGLRIASGALALFNVAVAALSLVLLVVVIRGADDLASALGGVIILVLCIIAMSVFGVSFIIAGILLLTNVKHKSGTYIAATVLGVFDILAAILIIAVGCAAIKMGSSWYICLMIPFAADFALRIVCTAICVSKKEITNE